ncbi:MAG: gamma-glutamyl-gamma-aminobutyrate hydrolase family protein [Natronospirillum sp.]|uniref:gamma-glutamyl-gamma-aminobutyrate hydrolase family protein n=1 Tax=Natronospirillum sp. TaxID=2812955 RepID=UPI0025D52C66|nr:gamma-glutamyl-gamma-aminobutyrate hydrolase family protein [Natronospirillum sp.]MCH8552797.1 gamma-glutamyl-gamma-aminobutyrate hydrolase family protein [Natronospirillum sp.]
MNQSITMSSGKPLKQAKGKPWVGVVTDMKTLDPHRFYAAGEKYLQALTDAADVVPVLLPLMSDRVALQDWLARLDGVFLTGAYSNVHPRHFDQTDEIPDTEHDEARDALSLDLIRAVLGAGKPLFGVCRGFQEMNVALGGSLHQNLHLTGLYQEHREDKSQPLAVQYGPAHEVELTAGGQLAQITGTDRMQVNSVHTQGVAELAQGLQVEARAADGLVEAFSVISSSTFALGVQWHPEWEVLQHPHNRALFAAFGNACREAVPTTSSR